MGKINNLRERECILQYLFYIIYEGAITPFTQDYLNLKWRKRLDDIEWKKTIKI